MKDDWRIVQLAERLARRPRVTVLTGAGVSAASGVPTFRGADGLWRTHRPEELATPSAFARDPALVWEWYDWRRQRIANCRPNRAHEVLAAWSRRYPDFTLVTQNVDGLHERASTTNVVRFHGSIWELRCWRSCGGPSASWWDEQAPLPTLPPRCPACGELARPGVVWFGEDIPAEISRRASRATEQCSLFLSIGTSSVVYPAAGLIHLARQAGAFTVEINPDRTPAADAVDLAIEAPAESALDRVEALLAR